MENDERFAGRVIDVPSQGVFEQQHQLGAIVGSVNFHIGYNIIFFKLQDKEYQLSDGNCWWKKRTHILAVERKRGAVEEEADVAYFLGESTKRL